MKTSYQKINGCSTVCINASSTIEWLKRLLKIVTLQLLFTSVSYFLTITEVGAQCPGRVSGSKITSQIDPHGLLIAAANTAYLIAQGSCPSSCIFGPCNFKCVSPVQTGDFWTGGCAALCLCTKPKMQLTCNTSCIYGTCDITCQAGENAVCECSDDGFPDCHCEPAKMENELSENFIYMMDGINRIYPNPSNGILSVEYSAHASSRVEWIVYDVIGRAVFSQTDVAEAGSTTFHFNFNDFISGIYLLEVRNGNTSSRMKFMIEK